MFIHAVNVRNVFHLRPVCVNTLIFFIEVDASAQNVEKFAKAKRHY